jgi:hypothetical protein
VTAEPGGPNFHYLRVPRLRETKHFRRVEIDGQTAVDAFGLFGRGDRHEQRRRLLDVHDRAEMVNCCGVSFPFAP